MRTIYIKREDDDQCVHSQYLLDNDNEVMRFPDIESAKEFMGPDAGTVHYVPEDGDESLYRDIMESFMLALKPHIGKTLTDDIVCEIRQTVHDAVGNNIFS